jgi:hypothetical protein
MCSAADLTTIREKKNRRVGSSTRDPRFFHIFSTRVISYARHTRLTPPHTKTTLGFPMSMACANVRRTFCRALVVCAFVLGAATTASVAAESVLYRVFLVDGSVLISYGEFARVADRVVFSIPLGDVSQTPALQIVSIPESTVDWTKTERYANAVRAQRYGETRGESDFALLSARVADALNQIALTPDPARRLAMAKEARATLAKWPADNFGYRASEVAQLTGMLDEVISELSIAAGESSFDLSLVATTAPPPEVPLLPAPTLRETIEQALTAARATAEASERISLLRGIEAALTEPSREGGWAAAMRARATAELGAELKIEKAYADLTTATAAAAAARAQRGDVTGIRNLLANVLRTDDRLGHQRPQETSSLLGLLDLRLEEARRVRLARDAWIARADQFSRYRSSVQFAIRELRQAAPALEDIRELAGPAPRLLPQLEQHFVMARQRLATIDVPGELAPAHALFTAALQMATRAASTRRTAVSSGNMSLAWEASSAAAGALLLLDRAGDELDRLTAPPANR